MALMKELGADLLTPISLCLWDGTLQRKRHDEDDEVDATEFDVYPEEGTRTLPFDAMQVLNTKAFRLNT